MVIFFTLNLNMLNLRKKYYSDNVFILVFLFKCFRKVALF